MKKGAFVNLLIGTTIAILPLYNRICAADFQRTAKDNLLCVIFCALGFLLPSSVRKMSVAMYSALVYGLFFLVFNQWNVLSINVMMQTFYIASAMCFFAHFYEKHDRESIKYILNGMIVGALIQSVLAIPGYWGINIYEEFLILLSGGTAKHDVIDGSGNIIGSLGNINLLASYLAICSLAFLSLGKLRYLVIIPIIAMLMNGSLMGILSLVAGAVYYFTNKKWQLYLGSIVGMFAGYFTGMGGHDSGRIDIWNSIFEKVTWKHFIIGMGPGWFGDARIMFRGVLAMQEHSGFLSVFNVFGIAGFILLLPIFVKFIFARDKSKIFASILFVAWCNAYGHFSLNQSTVVIIILVTAAICLAEGYSDEFSLER